MAGSRSEEEGMRQQGKSGEFGSIELSEMKRAGKQVEKWLGFLYSKHLGFHVSGVYFGCIRRCELKVLDRKNSTQPVDGEPVVSLMKYLLPISFLNTSCLMHQNRMVSECIEVFDADLLKLIFGLEVMWPISWLGSSVGRRIFTLDCNRCCGHGGVISSFAPDW